MRVSDVVFLSAQLRELGLHSVRGARRDLCGGDPAAGAHVDDRRVPPVVLDPEAGSSDQPLEFPQALLLAGTRRGPGRRTWRP